jgi:hypothetical protein
MEALLKLRYGQSLNYLRNHMDMSILWYISNMASVFWAMTMQKGKKDHRHYGDKEMPYKFESIENLFLEKQR